MQSRLIQQTGQPEHPPLPIHVLSNLGIHGEPEVAVCGRVIGDFYGYRSWPGDATEATCEGCLDRIHDDPSLAAQQVWAARSG